MTTLMFYEKPVALNRETHKNFKIAPSGDFKFAAKTNSIVLAGVEFIEASKEYPIVFAKISDDVTVPVALLSLRNDENLYVNAEGKWDARYIPAFVRRYPFVLSGDNDAKQFAVCIDEAYPGLNEKDGQPLFDKEGENTPFLQNALDFVNNYQTQYRLNEGFVKKLKELDLFTEISAKAELAGGKSYLLNGVSIIDEQKLLKLKQEDVFELFQSGYMGWIYAHLMSLSNMSRLLDKMKDTEAA
ncbi:MAG: SapC family protein [Gallionella sp.]|nr:SapC family protein [Gallionella sp.]